MDDEKRYIMSALTQMEIDNIYHMQQRIYWEADFVDRCIERRSENVGLCDLPYGTLAYGLYCKMEDCNTAYNDTLDAVIDEVEQCIARGYIGLGRSGYYAGPEMF